MAQPPTEIFPWRSHRTIAEVRETEQLLAGSRYRDLTMRQMRRRQELLAMALRNNPPMAAKRRDAGDAE